jgi:hypothetical protein
MQSSQLTLEPHARVILVEYEFVLTLASLLFCSILGYLPLLLSARQRGGLRQRLRRLLGVCLPVDVPVAPSSSCISFTLPQLLNRFLIRL